MFFTFFFLSSALRLFRSMIAVVCLYFFHFYSSERGCALKFCSSECASRHRSCTIVDYIRTKFDSISIEFQSTSSIFDFLSSKIQEHINLGFQILY